MKKACVYCGRIHNAGYICSEKPKYYSRGTYAEKTRSLSLWQKTRERIRERDNNICQCCLRNYPGTIRQYEYEGLSVHHIIPILEEKDKVFDENNLILLCFYHHERAETGEITRKELMAIVEENNRGNAATLA